MFSAKKRHVILPKELAKDLPKRLLTETEWRGIGVQQSRGWIHYAIHRWIHLTHSLLSQNCFFQPRAPHFIVPKTSRHRSYHGESQRRTRTWGKRKVRSWYGRVSRVRKRTDHSERQSVLDSGHLKWDHYLTHGLKFYIYIHICICRRVPRILRLFSKINGRLLSTHTKALMLMHLVVVICVL